MPGWAACKGRIAKAIGDTIDDIAPGYVIDAPERDALAVAVLDAMPVNPVDAYQTGWDEGRAALQRDAAAWADKAMALFEEPETPGADVIMTEPINPAPVGTPIEAPDAMLPEGFERVAMTAEDLLRRIVASGGERGSGLVWLDVYTVDRTGEVEARLVLDVNVWLTASEVTQAEALLLRLGYH